MTGKEEKKKEEEITAGGEPVPEGEKAGAAELTEEEYTELKKKAEERDEYHGMFLRAKADFQNYQKRARKETEMLNRLAVQDVLNALLPVLDNLTRALKSVGGPAGESTGKPAVKSDAQSLEKFLHGVELIQGHFIKALGGLGVKAIHWQEGQVFDPELHEAVMEVENNGLPHHTVLEEIEQGFFLHDKVLRPAKVKVSRRVVNEVGEEKAKEGAKEGNVGGLKAEGKGDGPAGMAEEGPEKALE
jgi:molecular chaperone GrpE